MSSGDERLNGDILDGSEQGKRALGHRASLRKGSVCMREIQRALQSSKGAVGPEDSLGRHRDRNERAPGGTEANKVLLTQ